VKNATQKGGFFSMSNLQTKLDVRVHLVTEPKNKTVAYAGVTIDDKIAIKGIQVIDGMNGLFAKMPQTKVGDEYKDIAFPVTGDLRKQLNKAVVDAYVAEKSSVKEQIKEGQAAKDAPAADAPAKDSPAKEAVAAAKAASKGKSSKAKAEPGL
jgi:DNA-binding cell septation regulator SpoVG